MSDQRLIGESIRSSNDSAALMVVTVKKSTDSQILAAGTAVQSVGQLGAGFPRLAALGQHARAAGQPYGQLWRAALPQPGLRLPPH